MNNTPNPISTAAKKPLGELTVLINRCDDKEDAKGLYREIRRRLAMLTRKHGLGRKEIREVV